MKFSVKIPRKEAALPLHKNNQEMFNPVHQKEENCNEIQNL